MTRVALAIFIGAWMSNAAAPPHGVVDLRGRLGFEDRLEAPLPVLAALDQSGAAAADLRVFVRLSVAWATLERAAAGDWSAIDERLAAYARRAIPVVVAIGPTGPSDAAGSWVPVLQSAARHLRGRVVGYQIEAALPRPDPRAYAFQLKLASVQIRAIDEQVHEIPQSDREGHPKFQISGSSPPQTWHSNQPSLS